MLKKSIAISLGLDLHPSKLSMSTLHGTQTTSCAKADLRLESLTDGFTTLVHPAIVVESLPVNEVDNDSLNSEQLPHLRDVPFIRLYDRSVGILIGCDVPEAHWVMEQRIGTNKQPFASRSPFGWVLRGPIDKGSTTLKRVSAIISDNPPVDVLIEKMG